LRRIRAARELITSATAENNISRFKSMNADGEGKFRPIEEGQIHPYREAMAISPGPIPPNQVLIKGSGNVNPTELSLNLS